MSTDGLTCQGPKIYYVRQCDFCTPGYSPPSPNSWMSRIASLNMSAMPYRKLSLSREFSSTTHTSLTMLITQLMELSWRIHTCRMTRHCHQIVIYLVEIDIRTRYLLHILAMYNMCTLWAYCIKGSFQQMNCCM